MTHDPRVTYLPDDVVPLDSSTLPTLHARGLAIPTYDRARLRPRIAHIGVGAFHRSHLAVYCHQLAGQGSDWGIRGLGLLPHDAAIGAALHAQDHLYSVTLKAAHTFRTEVIGSIIDFRMAAEDATPAIDAVADPETAIVSMTVTEAGYLDSGISRRTFDIIAAGLDRRRRDGQTPVTILSCDNVPGNGDVARARVLEAAGRMGPECVSWVEQTCTFPNSMVDRITPVTGDADREHVELAFGLIDRCPVVAEPFRQWALEDRFAAGRPAFQDVEVLFTDDVHMWKTYKLRFLNAGHTAIAYLAALAGVSHVDEAVTVPELGAFLAALLLDEALPTVDPIPGHPPEQYVASVLERFANSGVRDQIARLCVDGTTKIAGFLMPTISAQVERDGQFELCALAMAGWAHYLSDVPPGEQARDDHSEPIRELALAARGDPSRFVAGNPVFPYTVANHADFGAAFERAHRLISEVGPLGAISATLR